MTLQVLLCGLFLLVPSVAVAKPPKKDQVAEATTRCGELKAEVDALSWATQVLLSQQPGQHSLLGWQTVSAARDRAAVVFKRECSTSDEWLVNARFYELAALRGAALAKL